MYCPKAQTSDLVVDKFIRITEEEFKTGKNLDEKLAMAAKMGFFYLEIPADCKPLIKEAVELANTFYQDNQIKEEKLEGFSGYHDREGFQVESRYLEQKYWKEKLSPSHRSLAKKMHLLAIEVLKKILTVCDIPKEESAKITGNVTEKRGAQYFTCNHYRQEKSDEGMPAHRDFGQITVLYINKLGLEAKINNEWLDVKPIEGYFVVNFGRALETSINNENKVKAAWHRVRHVEEDRISIGVFTNNEKDSTIHQKTKSGEIVDTGKNFEKFLEECFSEIYVD